MSSVCVDAAPRAQTVGRVGSPSTVTFDHDVLPMLRNRCDPCHFPGGKVHASLPFDDKKTVLQLGEKLFTRIKADEDRAILRAFFETGH